MSCFSLFMHNTTSLEQLLNEGAWTKKKKKKEKNQDGKSFPQNT